MFFILIEEPFLIKFPRILPFDIPEQVELKNKELLEENIDPGIFYENKFKNSFLSLENLSSIGKLRVYKSGKIKLQIGENIFDVTQGLKNSFHQEVILETDNSLYMLSKLKSEKLLVAPEI